MMISGRTDFEVPTNTIRRTTDGEWRHHNGDIWCRPAHVPASVPDSEVDRYLDWYPYPGA
jgi:hypothetical protein